MYLWMTNAMHLVKIPLRITKNVKIQDGRQLWLKKVVLGIKQAANFLSCHMSLAVVMNCGVGSVPHGIEIGMFWYF